MTVTNTPVSPRTDSTSECTLAADGRRVRAPWHEAEILYHRLHKAGLGVTLHLDPLKQEAFIEPWEGVSPEQVLEVLRSDPAEHWP